MKALRRLLAVALIGRGLLAVGGGPAFAADPTASGSSPAIPRLGLGVGPSQVILGASERNGSFTVYNAGDVDLSIAMKPFDFVVDSDGRRVESSEPGALGAAGWLAPDPATFTIATGSSQVVTFSFAIPTDAPPGDHYAGIRVLGTLSDAAWAQLRPTLGDAKLRAQVAFSETVIVRVTGEQVGALTADPGIPSLILTTSNEFTFRPRIVNQSNLADVWLPAAGTAAAPETIVPTLRLVSTIGALAGDRLLYVRSKDGGSGAVTVLPGATSTQQMAMDDVPLVGVYDYTYMLPGSEADGRAPVVSSGRFTIVNLQKVALFIVLPIVLLLVLIVLWLVRRRHARRQRELARREREQDQERVRQETLDEVRRERAAHDAAVLEAVRVEEGRQDAADREGLS